MAVCTVCASVLYVPEPHLLTSNIQRTIHTIPKLYLNLSITCMHLNIASFKLSVPYVVLYVRYGSLWLVFWIGKAVSHCPQPVQLFLGFDIWA